MTEDAPDPRDLFWSNVGVDLVTMERRKIFVQAILLLGIIGWSYFVDFIQKIINKSVASIQIEIEGSSLKEGELIRYGRLIYAKLYVQSSPLTSILQSCLFGR
jgi:hypothetical protein